MSNSLSKGTAPISGAKHELRVMQAQGRGSIVNLSSTMGSKAAPGASMYTANKHAVEGPTKSAALEAAAFGVRVNAVAPGPIETGMLNRFTGTADRKAKLIAGVLRRNSILFGAAVLMRLGCAIAGPAPALAAAPQHHDQVPGFYRLMVGDLEVTALYDGAGAFDPHWLNGKKSTLNGVAETLREDPHVLDISDMGFLINTGKQVILVDAGAGTWWGGGAFGRLANSLRSAGYTPDEMDRVLVTHLHADHIGGLTTQDGQRVFPNANIFVSKAESDFWLSPEIAAKAPKEEQTFFQSAQAIAAPYLKAGKWHTFSGSDAIADGVKAVPLLGHTPGHMSYEFSSKGQKILFWGDIVHAQRVQLTHPGVTAVFDIDQPAAAATRNRLLPTLSGEDVLIAGPHMAFPGLGRLHKDGNGYSWAPVVYTDEWVQR